MRLGVVGSPGTYRGVELSPDGTRIAVHDHQENGGDIWVVEPRGTVTRVTLDPSRDNASPVWSPDGREIAFGSLRDGRWGLYRKRADGEGGEQLVIESEAPKIPASWTPDGEQLVYWQYGDGLAHQWVLPLDGQTAPRRLVNVSSAYDGHSQVSPGWRT